MTERKTLEELAAETHAAEERYCFSQILHVKSGNDYVITGVHHREHDMALSIEYSPLGKHYMQVYFSRSLEEMDFGNRFVFVGGVAGKPRE